MKIKTNQLSEILDNHIKDLSFGKEGHIKEILYPNQTKCKRQYSDGTILTAYPNHTIKAYYPDGKTQIWFQNGDWKIIHNNIVKYFYHSTQTLQITHASGLIQNHYSNGLIERIHPKPNYIKLNAYVKVEIWQNSIYKRIIVKKCDHEKLLFEEFEEIYPNINFPDRPTHLNN